MASDPVNRVLNQSLIFGASIGYRIIAALKVYEAALGDLFGPAYQIASWIVAPPVIREHFLIFDSLGRRIKVRLVKGVVAREKRFNFIFEHLEQVEFISHREGFGQTLCDWVSL